MKLPSIKFTQLSALSSQLSALTPDSRRFAQKSRFYTLPPALVAGVLLFQQAAAQSKITDAPLVVSHPSGVAVVSLSGENQAPLATPFDAVTATWLTGATSLLAWNPTRQEWERYTLANGSWTSEHGSTFALPLAGEAIIPQDPAKRSIRVFLSGTAPRDPQRALALSPGLNLAGDPYNLYAQPLAATWRVMEQEEDATLVFDHPVVSPDGPKGLLTIVPVASDPDVGLVEYRIDRGAYEATRLGIFSLLLFDGLPYKGQGGWRPEAVIEPGAGPITWTDEIPELVGRSLIKLVLVAPLVDFDGNRVSDAVERLVLGANQNGSESSRTFETPGLPRMNWGNLEQRASASEFAALKGQQDRLKNPGKPWLEVNESQEKSVKDHQRRGNTLRQAGLAHEKDGPLGLFTTLPAEAK